MAFAYVFSLLDTFNFERFLCKNKGRAIRYIFLNRKWFKKDVAVIPNAKQNPF
jgi:hypothetical protein